ncbi:Protein phosphatase PTC7 [Gryganskiella cystojenkinii]|nr:Protein phosphatase PTC7 [Gryganskiella cystojenkinii]
MLGRNAARPFGMTPSRLVAVYSTAASQRITHWITKPFVNSVHMQRYITIAPQLLLTTTPPNALSSLDLSSPLSAAALSPLPSPTATGSGSSGACHVHTSATSFQQQQQQQQENIQPPPSPLSGKQKQTKGAEASNSVTAESPGTTTAAAAATASGTTTTTAPLPGSAVAFNYLLAASWHPKSRTQERRAFPPRRPPFPTSGSSSASEASEEEDGGDKAKWWKQKLRAGKVDAGEDAFFHVSTPSRVALGVADGVGGWSEVGVDPALFSWALMDNAEAMARLTDADHSRSSTACILSLCKMTGTLKASNLGDSAFLLIRDNKCIYESPSQQHFWNCPYQLTVLPPGYPGAKQHVMDMPKDAAQTSHQLQDGDVIVLATDGFWDNVFTKEAIELVDRELGDIIQQSKKLPLSSQQLSVEDTVGRVRALSQRLTNTARRFSMDQKRNTPFSQGARHIRSGGKIDDITVIVTLVRALANQEHA